MTHVFILRRILVLAAIVVAMVWVNRRWPGHRPPGGPGGPSPA